MAIESDKINFTIGFGGKVENGAREAGIKLAADILSQTDEELKAVIMLTDVLTGNGADIVRGVQDKIGENTLIMGGAAGDDFEFKKTYVYYDNEVHNSSIVGVGLSGDFSVGVGVRHGWSSVGLPSKVTKSSGAIIEEINNRPAISIYEDYFGKKADDLRKEPLAKMAITYPLGMSVEDNDELLIRAPITADIKGAITCAAEIPVGSEVRLMLGSREDAIRAAKSAAQNALKQLGENPPKAALIFNCIAREKLFGREANKEILTVQSIIGEDTPVIGFYTYGEIAPIGEEINQKYSRFHNETFAILLISD